ncbi:heat shock protein family A (Hsp70) member 13 [Ictidomys tridecemlineatus]|uniref:Heat shock 70 kDa protein 13 n=1 Tax=Ictidomys tridecemlineatus TaxID=43179 RepID=I3MGX3_ICTTR|nr:heat shock 70 kDa protein 13 [Ictidomys tridecemlineatus]KAG3283751.1 heat shock protein family A (Hsp70) member 13 [Ictidomys tridecemlineatus]
MAGEMTILGSAVLTLLLAGYLAQQYLPLPTPKVIGIDLGTTYCSVGVFFPGTGKVKVIPDENGHISIPSMVSFTDSDVYVGYESLELADSNPQNTIYDAKRFIGKIFTPEELEAEIGRYPFKVLNKNGLVEFSVTSNETITVSPEYVGSRLLLKLKEMAEEYLGMPVANAVISVPAEFDLKQRNSTIEAANLAGLKILRVINEPTAAAMAYGLHKADVFHVLVIDLGGGTLDVSLLNKQGGMFLTRAMSGNNKLGGQDFNQRLLQYLYKLVYQTYGFLPSRKEEIHRLRQAVEMVKLNLTLHQSAQISVLLTVEEKDGKEAQSNDTELPKDKLNPVDGHAHREFGPGLLEKKSGKSQVLFETEISRKLFDSLNEDLFQKILVPIQQVLKEGHLDKTEIDEVVLVGGSTRIPRIRQVIQEFFGKDPNTSVDPDLAVVTGVAIQAGIDGGSWPLQVSALEIPNKHLQKTNFN